MASSAGHGTVDHNGASQFKRLVAIVLCLHMLDANPLSDCSLADPFCQQIIFYDETLIGYLIEWYLARSVSNSLLNHETMHPATFAEAPRDPSLEAA